MPQAREYGENEIMGDAPQSIERRLILPTLDNMSFGDLRYIADSIDEYGREVQAMLEQKREERIAELKAQVEADKARTAGWLKEKLEAGASLEDFLIDQPTTLSAADDSEL